MQSRAIASPAPKWRTKNNITFTLLIAAIIVLVVASPLAVKWIANNGSGWSLLSDVGQTYGFAAALLSGLAFLAIAISLFYQARQTAVSQLQAMRTLQLELLKIAYEHPDLQEPWGRTHDLPYPEWRKRSYMNLIFMYFRMGYIMHETTDNSLHRIVANRFRTRMGRTYWSENRQVLGNEAKNRRDRRFFQIVEQEYQKSIQTQPLEEIVESPSRNINPRTLLTFAAGGATIAVASQIFHKWPKK